MADDSDHGKAKESALSSGEPLHRLLRRKRRAAGLSQQELSSRVGIAQSALSAFERGGIAAHALSREHIVHLAEVLGLSLDDAALGDGPVLSRFTVFFCPNADCPMAVTFPLGRYETGYGPRLLRARADLALRCGYCGEVCERSCPECGAPVSVQAGGVCCPSCGGAYVSGAVLTAAELDCRRLVREELRCHGGVVEVGE